ncbi:MAG: two-component system sensor histidine kinase BarA [Motiliproteus sp.]|jgi:two-component system sensor histidine kinase BarA
MKLPFRIYRLSIGRQVMLTALLPLLLLTFTLSGYMISSRIQDAQSALDDQAETSLEFLATGAEFGMLTQNVDVFEQLTRGPIKRPEVSNIMFINAQSQLLYQSQERPLDFARVVSQGLARQAGQRIRLAGLAHSWVLVRPVLMSTVRVDDFDHSLAPQRYLGAVVLILSDRTLLQQQQQIILWGLMISALALLLAALLAVRIGRNISAPIQALSHSLMRYQSGTYQSAIAVSHQQEIGALQQGIKALIDQVQQHQQLQQRDVDRATRDLKKALAELEQSHQTLQQSKDQVELAGRAKDNFMARMSHELRTPISSVIGFVQLLEKSTLSESQHEYCRIILGASSLLLRLIDDVLNFSKFQSDNLKLESIPFSPERCVEDVLEMQAPAAGAKGLALELQCDVPWPLVLMGDPTRFSQIISNLISNAIKFTEQGEVRVRLLAQEPSQQPSQQQGKTRLQIDIEDTGIGISAAELTTLFQPFTQADTSISRRFGGSGLGLVISKRLVELMHGELVLTSVVGEGSHLSISLCLDRAMESAPSLLPPLNVLICCPDARRWAWLGRQLSDWGCHVDSLNDRQQLVPHMRASALSYDRVFVHLPLTELKALSWSRFLNPVRESFTGKLILVTEQPDEDSGVDATLLVDSLAPATLLRLPVGRYRLFNALEDPCVPSAQALLPNMPLQDLRVLVVEDNRFNRLLLTRMLEAQGALVEAAANGQDAVTMLGQTTVDLIIIDLHMPVMGGAQACRQIRQLPSASAQTPILILTADVISDEAELCASLGLEGIIYKPVDEQALVKQILGALRSEERRETSDVALRLEHLGISEQKLQRALEEQFDALQQALLVGDVSKLHEQAHQLSGLAVMVGLDGLDSQVRGLMLVVQQERMDEAWPLFWAIKKDFDKSHGVHGVSKYNFDWSTMR